MSSLAGKRVAIANRAEIAVRIAATCRRLGMLSILLLDEPDRDSFAARQVGRVELIGPVGSLFDVERVVGGAKQAKADFLHPGYGFLSERASLAEACAGANIQFVGPSPATLHLCGDKLATREAAIGARVPVLPASTLLDDDPDHWLEAARAVGYPLIVKPSGAGGGRGLRRVAAAQDLAAAVRASRRESATSGAGDAVYLERELIEPRHLEVQVAADSRHVITLGDRDCSLQRRHQKVVEEAPSPQLAGGIRRALHDHAREVARAVGLIGVATCEFLLGADGALAFLEVNPRIQVEHPVTEIVTGIDLVEWQFRIAAGADLPLRATPNARGHAIEARIYAEDPATGFLPAQGALATVSWPMRPAVRIDAGYAGGDAVRASYDSMLAKVIAHGANRVAAMASLEEALRETIVAGVSTNVGWLLAALAQDEVRLGRTTTRSAARVPVSAPDRSIALAAAVAWTLDRPDAEDAWSAIGPFRLIGPVTLTFHGNDWEDRVSLSRGGGGWILGIGSTALPLRWWRDESGVWTVLYGDAFGRFAIVDRRDTLEVAGGGGRWMIRRGARTIDHAGKRRRVMDGKVVAPMTARVLHVAVAVGDRVTNGQVLAMLEAMKMELACVAPAPGAVDAVACRTGEVVAAGALLISLRLDDANQDPAREEGH
jgi:acetyl/propionyl-CoA carboxylase alpha subunit